MILQALVVSQRLEDSAVFQSVAPLTLPATSSVSIVDLTDEGDEISSDAPVQAAVQIEPDLNLVVEEDSLDREAAVPEPSGGEVAAIVLGDTASVIDAQAEAILVALVSEAAIVDHAEPQIVPGPRRSERLASRAN